MSLLEGGWELGRRAIVAGVAAAALTLTLDWTLAVLTEGYVIPLPPRLAMWYPLCGLIAALALAPLARHLGRGPVWLFAATVAALYAPPIFERFAAALLPQVSRWSGAGVAVIAVAAYGIWLFALCRISGRPHHAQALVLGAIAVAVGLALNRGLVGLPLERAALLLDAIVLGSGIAAAAGLRRLGGGRRLGWLVGVTTCGFLAAVGWRLASPLLARGRSATATTRAPVLVLTVIDTLRFDAFQDVVRSTAEGARFRAALGPAAWFTQAIAVSPWTAPSVASILTGLYPSEHGFGLERSRDPSRPLRALSPAATTLAELLAQRGFATMATTTNPYLQADSGIAQGFATFEMLQDPVAKLPLLTALRWSGQFGSAYQSASWVRRRFEAQLFPLLDSDRAVFAWLHLMDPHSPLRDHAGLSADPAGAGLPDLQRRYREEVRYTVQQLALLLERLHGHPRWRDTSFVLISDHGEVLPTGRQAADAVAPDPARQRYGHGHALFEELVRVPLLIRPAGGLPKARRLATLLSQVDLLPTLLDLVESPLPPLPPDRISAAAWLGGDPRSGGAREAALSGATSSGPRQRSWRGRRFKVIHYIDGERPDQLFDLRQDPGEQHDLATSQPARLGRLLRQLDRYWRQLRPQLEQGEPVAIDAAMRKKLEALGYL